MKNKTNQRDSRLLFLALALSLLACQQSCVSLVATRPGRISAQEDFLPSQLEHLHIAQFKGQQGHSEPIGCEVMGTISHHFASFVTMTVCWCFTSWWPEGGDTDSALSTALLPLGHRFSQQPAALFRDTRGRYRFSQHRAFTGRLTDCTADIKIWCIPFNSFHYSCVEQSLHLSSSKGNLHICEKVSAREEVAVLWSWKSKLQLHRSSEIKHLIH